MKHRMRMRLKSGQSATHILDHGIRLKHQPLEGLQPLHYVFSKLLKRVGASRIGAALSASRAFFWRGGSAGATEVEGGSEGRCAFALPAVFVVLGHLGVCCL